MDDSKLVHVADAHCDLVCQILNSALRQRKSTLLNVVEQVLALHELEHDKVGLAILKEIDQLDDVVVLTHLEDFDLTTLLKYLNRLHIGLFDSFDGSCSISHLVSGKLHKAKLSFAESFAHLIEVK